MTTEIIYIDGMTCSACGYAVERAALALPGVSSARADFRRGQMEEAFDAPCTRAQIAAAVEKTGYTVVESPAGGRDALWLLVILLGLYVIASGSFRAGALSMFFFCLGTVPLVFLFGAAAGLLKRKRRAQMLRLGAALLILMGIFTLQNNLALAGVTMPCVHGSQSGGSVQASVQDGVQYVITTLRSNGFDEIRVAAGIPVVWTIRADAAAINGCNNAIVLPAFNVQADLHAGDTVITFTPESPGRYSYTCWMGMLRSQIVVT